MWRKMRERKTGPVVWSRLFRWKTEMQLKTRQFRECNVEGEADMGGESVRVYV